jgi:predicted N-acyltransferase
MHIRVLESISAIPADAWNQLEANGNPFLRHEFLLALEESGAASQATGWSPCHIVCENDTGELTGALPLYLKDNSYGEFVFDFSWAAAYDQAGLNYYPKLVSAVPFTPATGPRVLIRPGLADSGQIRAGLLTGALNLAKETEVSSLHMLFPEPDEAVGLRENGLLLRKDCQFHWHNRGYSSFDDFLDGFTSSKRKKTRRERRRIREQGIRFETRLGSDLDERDWDAIMPLYRTTFIRRGREPYLGLDFFLRVSAAMPENVVVFMGYEADELVAVAICFRSDTVLYGRYWGASKFIDSLHFETCYYQGIDYCIEQGLQVFEPGTQGEHKISRGFVPAETWSAHWLSHPQFAAAVDDYLERERTHIESYIDSVGAHVPYRNETS